MVIVIITVLAVVALPRFLNLQSDSRIAIFNGAQSQFQSAITFAHSKWLVNGVGNSEMNDLPGFGVDTNGNPQLDMNDEGYPLGIDKNSPMGRSLQYRKRSSRVCRYLGRDHGYRSNRHNR